MDTLNDNDNDNKPVPPKRKAFRHIILMSSYCRNLDCRVLTKDAIRDKWNSLVIQNKHSNSKPLSFPICSNCHKKYSKQAVNKESLLVYPEGFYAVEWYTPPFICDDKNEIKSQVTMVTPKVKLIVHPARYHPNFPGVTECLRCKEWVNEENPSLHQCKGVPKPAYVYTFS